MTAVNGPGLLATADDPMAPRRSRELGQSQHFVLDIDAILSPGLAKLRIVKRRKNSDAEHTTVGTCGIDSSLHHFHSTRSMHRRETNAHRSDIAHRTRNRVRDVVKLEIQKHIASGVAKPLHNVRTGCSEQLASDFIKPATLIECLHERHRTLGVRKIEGNYRDGCHDCHSSDPTISLTELILCLSSHACISDRTRAGARGSRIAAVPIATSDAPAIRY